MSGQTTQREGGDAAPAGMGTDPVVVRRSGQGWQVGPEETADLTSAMVLADLLAADLGAPVVPLGAPPAGPPAMSQRAQGADGVQGAQGVEADEAARLAVTVAQLEHALSARVRVEQAIGVLAERHRLRPRHRPAISVCDCVRVTPSFNRAVNINCPCDRSAIHDRF
jgi:hypothetical protein